jgi:hypothetical protein
MAGTVCGRELILPAIVAHADWGKDPRKRQVAAARLTASSSEEPRYVVFALGPGGDFRGADDGLLHALRTEALPGQLMIGFDFPIGLPLAYASAAGIGSFPEFLGLVGTAPWDEFGIVARRPAEISVHRPFYPHAPSGARREHLRVALRLTEVELRRRCEGNDAETLFWTLGSKQVGKGALAGWRLLAAAQQDPGVALWPFAGSLPDLLDGGSRIVAAETYPREYYQYARMPGAAPTRWSKRRRADRLALAPGILAWAGSLGVGWDPKIRDRVGEGFSDRPNGEDEFDAVIGLLAMIGAVTGALPPGEPHDDPAIFTVEGWILGRPARSPVMRDTGLYRLLLRFAKIRSHSCRLEFMAHATGVTSRSVPYLS